MFKETFCIVISFTMQFEFICSLQPCGKSCNNNGICYIENGKEKCKCLDRIYIGDSCEKLVNYCNDNPCKNGGQCIDSPGYYICLCSKNFSGQNCTITMENKNRFGQVYLQYNHVTPVSQENFFLIILTDLAYVPLTVEMTTTDYVMVGFIFSSNNVRHFVKTNDIKTVAKKYGLPATSLPKFDVYYYVERYRMATNGIDSVRLSISDPDNLDLYYDWIFQFGSLKNEGCNPTISISNCGTPDAPVLINGMQSIHIEADINRDCGLESKMSYKWTISNYFDTKTLQIFNTSGKRSLRVPPYGIRIMYDKEDHFFSFRVIKLTALERSLNGFRYGETIKRCYVRMNLELPIAKISGGESQAYSTNQQILMDGSDSKDLLLHPKTDQYLEYMWTCSSSDESDLFCKNLNKNGNLNTLFLIWCGVFIFILIGNIKLFFLQKTYSKDLA